ncbi:MAG: hypothetical protein R3E83_11675 [Burkholderiaceae bacterium]
MTTYAMSASGRAGLRLGFACGSARLDRYPADLLMRLAAHTDWQPDTLIIAPDEHASSPGWLSRAVSVLGRRMLAAEHAMLRRLPPGLAGLGWRANALRQGETDVARLFAHVVQTAQRGAVAHPDTACGGSPALIITFERRTWARLRDQFADAHWLLVEPCVPAATAGMAGFDAVSAGVDRTEFRIYLAEPGAGQPELLLAGGNRTKLLFSLNQAALWDRIGSSLQTLLKNGMPRPASASTVRSAHGNRPEPTPFADLARLLRYPLGAAMRVARIVLGRRQWSVVIGEGDPLDPRARVLAHLQAGPGRFYADPQLIRSPDGRLHCFVEEFDDALGRARIAVLAEQSDRSWRRLGVALEEPHHLSFPFLFHYQDELFMCPEAFTSNRITVYRCVEFPLRWEAASVIMDDICAADSMLIEHGGKWWLLTNVDNGLAPDHQAELHVFHADSPLSTDWQPLAGNPVKVDPRGGRNGGYFVADDVLYRCGQCHSIDAYGKGLMIHRVTGLDADQYREEAVAELQIPAALRGFGTHTLSVCGRQFAIDMLR